MIKLNQEKGPNHIAIAMGTGFGASFLIIIIIGSLVWWRHRHNQHIFFDVNDQYDPDVCLGHMRRYAFKEIRTATNHFNSKNIFGQNFQRDFTGRVYFQENKHSTTSQQSPITVSPVLRAVGNIATGDDAQTQPKRTMSLVVLWVVATSKNLCWFSEFNVQYCDTSGWVSSLDIIDYFRLWYECLDYGFE